MARRRGFESVSDMVRSLGLVLLAVAAIVLITLRQTPDQAAPTVDPSGALAAARSEALLPVPAVATPKGWRVTSARYDSGPPPLLSLGYQLPEEQFAGWTLTEGDLGDAVEAVAPEAVPAEPEGDAAEAEGTTVSAAGVDWQLWTAPDRTVWTQERDGTAVVLVATGTDAAALRTLATGLVGALAEESVAG